jgi:hypothetical protein
MATKVPAIIQNVPVANKCFSRLSEHAAIATNAAPAYPTTVGQHLRFFKISPWLSKPFIQLSV